MCIQIRPDYRKRNILFSCKFILQIIDYIFDIVATLVALSFHSLISKINHELVLIAMGIFD